ncbi:hypothetical protein [Shimia sp.]|uniref:hypothetical protein n=1 Tax=Shimia sp. TaxID=1954381 RepID=UPI003299133C
MKPSFALSLSFDGIGLLKRVADGWHLLGEVSLSADDLAADLESLRTLGTEACEGPFATMVVLPNDQIKYLSLNTGRARDAKRRELAGAALEEATPYRVDQLSFDICAQGRETQVAAVARETLDEAEAFAAEHAFNPVCFTAMPEPGEYAGVPNFGTSSVAEKFFGDIEIVLDPTPIKIVGQGPLAPPPFKAEPVKAAPIRNAPVEAEAVAPEPAPQPAEQPVEQAALDPDPPAPDATDAAESPPPLTAKDIGEPVSFASIRARRDDPAPAAKTELGGASRISVGANAPTIPGDTGPTAERNLRFDPAKVAAGLKADPAPRPKSEDAAKNPAPEPGTEAPSSFFSRRAKRSAASVAPPTDTTHSDGTAAKADKPKQVAEKQRMTVFGARAEQEIGGKPKYLGLIMTAALLLFLVAVAVWATVFLEDGVAGLFKRDEPSQIVLLDPEAAVVADDPAPVVVPDVASQADVPVVPPQRDSASLDTGVLEPATPDSITDSAEVEAMTDLAHPTVLSENEAESRYAVTGIWERAPLPPATPTAGSTENFYATSIDRILMAHDAVALPDPASFQIDQPLLGQLNPVAPGTDFDLDDRGLVIATRSGALTPQGVMVYLGKPPVLPASLPTRSNAPEPALSREDASRLALVRPKLRPGNLLESNQRATLGGLSRDELASIRPKLRPTTEKEAAEADTTPTELAVAVSKRPRQRPSNIAQLAQRSKPTEPIVAVPAAASMTPKIPTTASVARQATIQNAINLRKVNLIGVYGTNSNRRALVRLANGRYKKVQVGDRIDGGKVAAIGDQELRYIKSGKNITLKMPKG